MKTELVTQADYNATFEARLWQTVIARAIQDWTSGSARRSRTAEKYLFENNVDFPMVCQSAGINIDRLRSELSKHRHRSLTFQKSYLAA